MFDDLLGDDQSDESSPARKTPKRKTKDAAKPEATLSSEAENEVNDDDDDDDGEEETGGLLEILGGKLNRCFV